MGKVVIHWFRQDLRLSDNPALARSIGAGHVLPIYILDDINAAENKMGSASRWWLHHSLLSLKKSLGGKLSVYKGDPINILLDIVKRHKVEAVFWNRCYEPWRVERDISIKETLADLNIAAHSMNGSLLWEPWTVHKADGSPYKVFTPFYKNGCLLSAEPRLPLAKPDNLDCIYDDKSIEIENLGLLPRINWDKKLECFWEIGEVGANKKLQDFLKFGVSHYKDGRNMPSKPYVSKLSAHLHFGEISANTVWYAVRSLGSDANIDHFCSELGWREFSNNLLYYNPDLPRKNLQDKFDSFDWNLDLTLLSAWQMGNTGIPMVDAGMRELWQTGYMHNRLRMVVGSFLVKNLRIHWHHGERWFWDTLIDANLANNSASWQWVAGCGADAAPYFRIFNPVTQGQKFDPDGNYIRYFVPEISKLPNKYLFSPWEAPEHVLLSANIKLGRDYPFPIVDLKASREEALEAFKILKNRG